MCAGWGGLPLVSLSTFEHVFIAVRAGRVWLACVYRLSAPLRLMMGAMSLARLALLHRQWAGLALVRSWRPPLSMGTSWSATNASGFGVRVPGR